MSLIFFGLLPPTSWLAIWRAVALPDMFSAYQGEEVVEEVLQVFEGKRKRRAIVEKGSDFHVGFSVHFFSSSIRESQNHLAGTRNV